MSSSTGKQAEEVAAEFLKSKGYKILAMNWRRPSCEIDIVASLKQGFNKPKKVHFFEVKYRKGDEQGSGIDYITPGKHKQMEFAARVWVSENNYAGDYELGAIEVTGKEFEVTLYLPHL